MSDDQVTVADFLAPAEAEVVRARLDEEGIPAIIIGDADAAALPGVTDPEEGIRLRVAAEHAGRARAILETVREEARADAAARGVPLTAAGHPGWVCPDCGAVNEIDIEVCPSCGRLMDVPEDQASATAKAIAAGEDVDGEEEKEELKTWVGDKLAVRAFRTAIIGLILAASPVLLAYAALMLLKRRQSRAALSDAGRTWAALTWAIIAAVAAAVVMILLAGGPPGLLLLGGLLLGRVVVELLIAAVFWIFTAGAAASPPPESAPGP